MGNETGIGTSVNRLEDARFLTGQGRFVGDITLPDQVHAYVVGAPHPSAEIISIDVGAAAAASGVLLVATGKDTEADGLSGIPCTQLQGDGGWLPGFRTHQPVLANQLVRHVGDRVALVVAESLDAAKSAAELIQIDYAPLPHVLSAKEAMAEGAPEVWPGATGNLGFSTQMGDEGAVATGLAGAHHVQRISVQNQRVSAVPLELRATIGDASGGRLTLYSTCQKPHTLRQVLAAAVFQRPETDFHIICPDVGGGFGQRGTVYPEDALVLWASEKLGRPVKWVGERSDNLTADAHARDQTDEGEMAFDEDGRITALEMTLTTNLGAYQTISAMVSSLRAAVNMSNVYAIPAIHVTVRTAFTHTAPLGPYRGAGLPEAVHFIERMMDDAAVALSLDAAELRRRNLIPADAMPYQTPLQYTYDSGDFEVLLEAACGAADYDGFKARRANAESRGRLRGLGMGFYILAITAFSERMEMRLDASGRVTVLAGTFSYGQGHETVYAQMVSDWLGVPLDHVMVVQGDTDRVAFGRGSFGSRSMSMGGSALKMAADDVIEKGKKIAGHLLEAPASDVDFEDGEFRVAGTDRAIALGAVAAAAYQPIGLPPGSGAGLEASAVFEGPFNFPNGCHLAEVEIDPETGAVEIAAYTAFDDVGVAVNPKLVAGQIHGGVAQGIGQALLEAVTYDGESGQMLSGSLMDYALPRAADIPAMELGLAPSLSQANPLGIKGAGENGCLAAPPAVINAILDALRPLGVTDIPMPATAETVWQAMQKAAAKD
ncbi:MAG: xanthine dehydrogenase family protein molybdopterin-binding subunit [Rhodospirillaceae bacterium]|nr:xanthine dehydrogenase family protein molybdopterin-binding subunit [Rhodospirillaceae bacterium]